MLARSSLVGLVAVLAFGCSSAAEGDAVSDDAAVKVDTRSAQARAQYDADVAFLNAYTPRCKMPEDPRRPRVLVTGFGRFMGTTNNATGRIVSTLVPAAKYPETELPPQGAVDPPEPQLSVGQATLTWPLSGEVEVCAMILPVYWDMAAILIAKELDAFQPSVVMMNGIAGARQEIWLELGATNKADELDDGSDQLKPYAPDKDTYAKIVDGGEDARPNLMTWNAVQAAAAEVVAKSADAKDGDVRFGDVLPGVKLAGFPRNSNTYLCNNVTYVTGWLMSHAGKTTKLLRAAPPMPGKINDVKVKVANDFAKTPRVFVHWPSDLDVRFHDQGAAIMQAILDTQLAAIVKGDAPTFGDDANADPTLKGGDTF